MFEESRDNRVVEAFPQEHHGAESSPNETDFL